MPRQTRKARIQAEQKQRRKKKHAFFQLIDDVLQLIDAIYRFFRMLL